MRARSKRACPRPAAARVRGDRDLAAAGGAGSRGSADLRRPKPHRRGPVDPSRPPLDVELETGGYAYNSGGRRDPFVSLQRPVAADRGPKTRKPGMEGFLIQEIALKGIVRTRAQASASPAGRATSQCSWERTASRISWARGRGSTTADHRRGRDLRDFPEEVTDPLSPVKTREVRKSLYASEEAR